MRDHLLSLLAVSAASLRRSALEDGLGTALTPASTPKAAGSWAPDKGVALKD